MRSRRHIDSRILKSLWPGSASRPRGFQTGRLDEAPILVDSDEDLQTTKSLPPSPNRALDTLSTVKPIVSTSVTNLMLCNAGYRFKLTLMHGLLSLSTSVSWLSTRIAFASQRVPGFLQVSFSSFADRPPSTIGNASELGTTSMSSH
jgi:hypothetical protein